MTPELTVANSRRTCMTKNKNPTFIGGRVFRVPIIYL